MQKCIKNLNFFYNCYSIIQITPKDWFWWATLTLTTSRTWMLLKRFGFDDVKWHWTHILQKNLIIECITEHLYISKKPHHWTHHWTYHWTHHWTLIYYKKPHHWTHHWTLIYYRKPHHWTCTQHSIPMTQNMHAHHWTHH